MSHTYDIIQYSSQVLCFDEMLIEAFGLYINSFNNSNSKSLRSSFFLSDIIRLLYVTVPEKRDLVTQNKKIEIWMLVSRFNRPLHCVKTLNLCARRDGWPNFPFSS